MRGRELAIDVREVRGAFVARARAIEVALTRDGERRTVRSSARRATTTSTTWTFDDARATWRRSAKRAAVLDRGTDDARVDVRAASGEGNERFGFCAVGRRDAGRRARGREGDDDGKSEGWTWIELRGREDGARGEILVRVREREIGAWEGDGRGREDAAREDAKAKAKANAREAEAVAEDEDEDEDASEDAVVDDGEGALPSFAARRGAGGRREVGGAKRAFALTVRLESFERAARGEAFDFDAAVAASACADDALADALGIDRARSECLVRTAPSARPASRPGDVVVFPSGKDSVDFACAPATLAETLARKPLLLVDVWSVAATSRVASAEIAIDELLRRPEVRYRAEVTDEDGVVVGRVRLYVRLEDRGALDGVVSEPSALKTPPPKPKEPSTAMLMSPPPVPSAQKPPPPAPKAQTRHAAPPTNAPADPRAGAEYKVAYDLEVWKQHQMTKFYEDLRMKESVRMKILEDEWRRHETQRAREAEEGANRLRIMEKKLQEAAVALESRERKLVELEENFDHRKHKLERETSRASEEAKDSIRRNQETSEHRVEMEKQKAREAIRERDSLHRRLEHADAQLIELESSFAAHKKAQLETNEAALQAEISRLVPRCEAAEAQAAEESESKERYKNQLTKMARQVVALERERAHLRRAIERAGLNVSSRSHVAPSANEFMNEMLAGENADADAFMNTFRADVAAVSDVPFTSAKANFARTAPQARQVIRPPLSPKLDREVRDFEHEFSESENKAPFVPKYATSDATLNEKRAAEKEVRRLVSERGDLMRTGMYGSGDKIIALIDERIEELTDRIASSV